MQGLYFSGSSHCLLFWTICVKGIIVLGRSNLKLKQVFWYVLYTEKKEVQKVLWIRNVFSAPAAV